MRRSSTACKEARKPLQESENQIISVRDWLNIYSKRYPELSYLYIFTTDSGFEVNLDMTLDVHQEFHFHLPLHLKTLKTEESFICALSCNSDSKDMLFGLVCLLKELFLLTTLTGSPPPPLWSPLTSRCMI